MNLSVLKTIETNFGLGSPPNKENLVKFDGFDELDKADALETFLGVTTTEILDKLAQPEEASFRSLSEIEGLSVMEPVGYQYYLAPFLTQIVRNENNGEPDLELMSFVLFAIREIVRIRERDAFSKNQRVTLLNIVKYLAEGCTSWDSSDAFAESLPEDFNWLQNVLSAD